MVLLRKFWFWPAARYQSERFCRDNIPADSVKSDWYNIHQAAGEFPLDHEVFCREEAHQAIAGSSRGCDIREGSRHQLGNRW
ncbi:MAG: hypothetical protein C4531_01350 [Desulfurivibrio sp.]|nr:MAG: hypothetical protein C4531_01350 [Desulfurivibrio sp.]